MHRGKGCNRRHYPGTGPQAIEANLYKQKQEKCKLYNPYRKLYLDKCYGESKRPAVDWMDFSKYKE